MEFAAALFDSAAHSSVGRLLHAAEEGLQGALDGMHGQTAAAACDQVGYQLVQSPGVISGKELTDAQVALCHNTMIDKRTGLYKNDMLTNARVLSDYLQLNRYPTTGAVFDGGKVHLRLVVPFAVNSPLHAHWKTYVFDRSTTLSSGQPDDGGTKEDPFLMEGLDGDQVAEMQVNKARHECRAIMYAHLEGHLRALSGTHVKCLPDRTWPHFDEKDQYLYNEGDLFLSFTRYGVSATGHEVSYERWVTEMFPCATVDHKLDQRYYFEGADARLMWNEFFWMRGFDDSLQISARLPGPESHVAAHVTDDQEPCGGPSASASGPEAAAPVPKPFPMDPPSDVQRTRYFTLVKIFHLHRAEEELRVAKLAMPGSERAEDRAPAAVPPPTPVATATSGTSTGLSAKFKRLFCCVSAGADPSDSPKALRKGAVSTISRMAFNRAVGIHNLLVVDVVIPLICFNAIDRLATQPMGAEKIAPAFLVGRAQSSLETIATNNATDLTDVLALRAACQLVLCAKIADLANSTAQYVTVTHIEGGSAFKQDEVLVLTAIIDAEVDRLKLAIAEAHGEIKLCVPMRDPPKSATQVADDAGIQMVLDSESFDDWVRRRQHGVGGGAVQTGPNLTGIECPLDPHSPATLLGAVSRHFADMEAKMDGGIPVAGEDFYTFTLKKREGDLDKLLSYKKVSIDILAQDRKSVV